MKTEVKMEERSKWYVLSVYAGLENNVVETIKTQAKKKGFLKFFEEFLIPSEQVVSTRNGSKVTKDRNYFPGYILIKVNMNDEVWSFICSLPRVNGFLGAKKPLPISEAEIERIFNQVKEAKERPRRTVSFEIGDVVKVCDGPFMSFSGTVESIEEQKERLTVSVMVFGRPTPIDLDFSQVEKV
jgi:transcriptional antiterminator NusG